MSQFEWRQGQEEYMMFWQNATNALFHAQQGLFHIIYANYVLKMLPKVLAILMMFLAMLALVHCFPSNESNLKWSPNGVPLRGSPESPMILLGDVSDLTHSIVVLYYSSLDLICMKLVSLPVKKGLKLTV